MLHVEINMSYIKRYRFDRY